MLGSHLWNLDYNTVLRRAVLPPGCITMCYADDTLILAARDDWREARSRARKPDLEALDTIVRSIGDLKLSVAPHKTQAMFFHGRHHRWKCGSPVCPSRLWLILNIGPHNGWPLELRRTFSSTSPTCREVFGEQFEPGPPELGREESGCRIRRLFAGVMHSITLYADPGRCRPLRRRPPDKSKPCCAGRNVG